MSGLRANESDVRATVRSFILQSFLPGEAEDTLADDTALISGGVVTSLSLLELATFLENQYDISIHPSDLNASQMDTIDQVVHLVQKLQKSAGFTRPVVHAAGAPLPTPTAVASSKARSSTGSTE